MTAQRHILQITSYPPPRTGWGVRVQFLKRYLEQQGHQCVILNLGPSRAIPSDEYETVLGAWDYLRKVWRFSRKGFVAHVHVNGASLKGLSLAIIAEIINGLCGKRCFLTFHAGVEQVYFPRPKYPLLFPIFYLLFAIPRTIICNSEGVKAKIVEYGVPQVKVVPIPAFSRQYLELLGESLRTDLEAFYAKYARIVFCYTKIRPLFYPQTLIEGFARVARIHEDVGLVICGVAGFMDKDLWAAVQASIAQSGLPDRVAIVQDLPHDAFLHALGRASIFLRTHVSDGVCSSVLESLVLGVPVVAAENGTRPPGVITYPPQDAEALAAALARVLDNREEIAAALQRPEITDTLALEVRLLTA